MGEKVILVFALWPAITLFVAAFIYLIKAPTKDGGLEPAKKFWIWTHWGLPILIIDKIFGGILSIFGSLFGYEIKKIKKKKKKKRKKKK